MTKLKSAVLKTSTLRGKVEPIEKTINSFLPSIYSMLAARASAKGNNAMFPIWLIVGIVLILLGIFNKQILRLSGSKPMSEIFTAPNLKHSSKITEKIGQWFVIILGAAFFVQGLGGALPNNINYKISFFLLGLSGLMVLAIIAITIANWKAR